MLNIFQVIGSQIIAITPNRRSSQWDSYFASMDSNVKLVNRSLCKHNHSLEIACMLKVVIFVSCKLITNAVGILLY